MPLTLLINGLTEGALMASEMETVLPGHRDTRSQPLQENTWGQLLGRRLCTRMCPLTRRKLWVPEGHRLLEARHSEWFHAQALTDQPAVNRRTGATKVHPFLPYSVTIRDYGGRGRTIFLQETFKPEHSLRQQFLPITHW